MDLTPDQRRDRERFDRYIEREQIASLMNNAKWHRAMAAIRKAHDQIADSSWPQWSSKDIRSDDTLSTGWRGVDDDEFWHGWKVYWEWIDLRCTVSQCRGALLPDLVLADHTSVYLSALLAERIPVSLEDGVIRIWGYARPGRFPSLLPHHPPK